MTWPRQEMLNDAISLPGACKSKPGCDVERMEESCAVCHHQKVAFGIGLYSVDSFETLDSIPLRCHKVCGNDTPRRLPAPRIPKRNDTLVRPRDQ
eukprot:CAMPEP_0174893316 /NCGR_PEP_ID=MMETSP0167-20121228/8146_1 /TAXON_ID=38298 /ORGANISM="Rhodella maculata, Strain CCMP736" /LENGTH=94 /DNA_ID=CAMNT_0016132075 /DNA_START=485 /DNA_END=769 /DNA_ORIENTATION=+